jgi:hypothetical protein
MHRAASSFRRFRFSLVLVAVCFALFAGAAPRHADAAVTVQVIPYAQNWQTTYNAFPIKLSFESLPLVSGLSITLQGGFFPAPQTYTSLPGLYDPLAANPIPGAIFNANTWDGTKMVTNFGYDPAKPAGTNWINFWGPTSPSSGTRITFNFANGAGKVGIGCSNFQSVNPPSTDSYPSVTQHRLYVNGVAMAQDIETLAGAGNWISGGNVRNGYVVITGTGGTVINSVGFETITPIFGNINDGMNFDAFGFTPVASMVSPGTWGRLKALYR